MTFRSTVFATGALFALATAAAWSAGPTRVADPPPAGLAVATFAGGCFWCMEPPFDKTAGVVSTTSGYTGGDKKGANYEQVSAGGTGHKEALRVVYDPAKVTYAKLLDVFWHNVDPVDAKGQFCDKGDQYKAAIFVHDDEQRKAAEESKAALERSGRLKQPVTVTVEPEREFWVAEDYHQDYYQKNPARYKFYRWNCGRDARLEAVWGAALTH
jgi:peptide-methionine (S)-S-oxide reductase